MRVGDICTRRVIVATGDESLVDAARRMHDAEVGSLVIVAVRKGRHVPIGMLTKSDVIGAVASEPRLIGYLRVVDAMRDDVVTVPESVDVGAGLIAMEAHGVRQLPVVDATGRLTGLLTLDDVIAHVDPRHLALVMAATLAQRRRLVSRAEVRA